MSLALRAAASPLFFQQKTSAKSIDYFNADARAIQLNGGSATNIPESIRRVANQEFERFIQDHVKNQATFAIETTLRSDITFHQAENARKAGFETVMHYLALNSVTDNLERVKIRADAGGHSAPESKLREIHHRSIRNLPKALGQFHRVRVYDNSQFGKDPQLLLESDHGRVMHLATNVPEWLEQSLWGTDYELETVRDQLAGRDPESGLSRCDVFAGLVSVPRG
ncbi:MAG: hypothetical protein ACR2NN_11080 [Bryobacteraceae bacterium]